MGQLAWCQAALRWSEQNGLRCCRLQAGALRRDRQRDEEHIDQSWLEKGLCGEEHTSRSNLWLDGRQPSQEVREQGIVKPGEEVVFLPTHTASNPCTGKVFTVEMH